MHEPDGYRRRTTPSWPPRPLEGRSEPSRDRPNSEDALGRGAALPRGRGAGFKLHPRSDAFGLPHPGRRGGRRLAHERRAPVLFHAGRGIPHLGEAVVDLARRYRARA
jgi:hypothetical protein